MCNEALPLNSFHNNKEKADGKTCYCKSCKKEYDKQRRKTPENKEKRRWINIYQRYGITKEDYLLLFQNQEGCCKICNVNQLDLKRPLVVDHCHASMKVRGLLCDNCNNGLGKFKDNTDFLKNAINYLEKTKD